MDKLLEVADQLASSATTSSVADVGRNPVWDFHCISRDEYLLKRKAKKEQLVLQYYNKIKMGEQLHFLLFVIVF